MQRWRSALARVGIRTPFARDALLAAVVAVVGVVTVVLNAATLERVVWLAAPTAAQMGLLSLAVVAGAVPLAWRRRAPALAAGVAIVGSVIGVVLASGQQDTGLALWIALYSVGAYSDRVRAAAVWVLASGSYIAALWAAPADVPTGVEFTMGQLVLAQGAASTLSFGIAVLLGAYVQTRRAYRAQLVDRAARLEREREVQAARAVADERARIARELHDVVAHHLSGMVVQAGAAERLLDRDPEQVREILGDIRRNGKATLGSMRRLIGILREDAETAATAPRPGLDALDLAAAQARAGGVDVEQRTEGERVDLPPEVDLAAYRVVQEALTNVRKHAPGARAVVTVRYRPHDVEVEVVDDGPAADAGPVDEEDSSGVGLVGMRERVSLLGGELSAGPRATAGWVVRARLPYAAPATHDDGASPEGGGVPGARAVGEEEVTER